MAEDILFAFWLLLPAAIANVAPVFAAKLPPFAHSGDNVDVLVSALGDSKSLQGGTLLVTPLLGADGNVYAVGQGSLAIGGFQVEGEAAIHTATKPTFTTSATPSAMQPRPSSRRSRSRLMT